jgi:hypothetical protein
MPVRNPGCDLFLSSAPAAFDAVFLHLALTFIVRLRSNHFRDRHSVVAN